VPLRVVPGDIAIARSKHDGARRAVCAERSGDGAVMIGEERQGRA